jgi:tripartite-type tricarboxylate transporter receptor subunit TctC
MPGLGPAMPFLKDGRLLLLAVNTPQRSPLFPDVPALVEVVPGFERYASHALMAPGRTPRPILNQISKDVARVLELPDVKQRMDNIGFTPAPTTPDEYDKIVRSQVRMFTEIAKDVGLIPK